MPEQSSRKSRLAVGLISGTSMDGIDAALVRISGPGTRPRVRLLAFETVPYPEGLRERLLAVAGGASTTAEEIDQLHTLLGAAFGEAAVHVCRRGRINPARLSVVGSHGQTIHHFGGAGGESSRPGGSADLFSKVRGTSTGGAEKTADLGNRSGRAERAADLKNRSALRLERPCTLQIAEPAWIAELSGAPVVSDFRPGDMAAGGQGAPLVPMVDYLLLRDARRGTVALNIGGIANFTVIPAGAKPEQVFGFDTGPGNMVIDALVRHFSKGEQSYDKNGRWAARGRVNEVLLSEALSHPFFPQPPPKSAGREQFGQDFVERVFLRAGSSPEAGESRARNLPIDNRHSKIENSRPARAEDLLRTATEITARSIVDALERFVLSKVTIHRLIVSGGGAHNRLLMTRLTKLLPKLRVHRSDEFGIDVDAKEAIAFAVLADRTMHGLPGNLPSVTGARRAVVLGKISQPGTNSRRP